MEEMGTKSNSFLKQFVNSARKRSKGRYPPQNFGDWIEIRHSRVLAINPEYPLQAKVFHIIQQCQFILKQQKMQQEQAQCLQVQFLYGSNRKEMDQKQEIYERGIYSALKNESLISLLSTRAPFNRTEKECRVIADYLKNQPYFENISKNFKTLLEISSWIDHRKVQGGEYIYRVHDVSDCFYVLLMGEVHLTFPEKQILEAEEDSLKQNDANSTKNLKQSSFYATAVPSLVKNQSFSPMYHQEELKASSRRKLTKHESLFGDDFIQIQAPTPHKLQFQQRIVQIISRGESFGDMGESNRRGTNSLAKEVCHLLIIKKQNFGTLSNAHTKSENKTKYELLSSLPLFKLLYRYTLESIIYLLEEVKVGYNNIVYNENDLIKYIYIIYKGEFKLYKKVKNMKENTKTTLENEQQRIQTKNLSFKTIQLGEILGYPQAYKKINTYSQTCVCKSQDGMILRIEKNKFLKKILSTESNLEQIIPFIEERASKRNQQIADFLRKHENDIFVRYLHTPSAKSRRINTESSVYKTRSQRKDELRKLSSASNNFFNEFNKTIKQEVRSTRISIKKSIAITQQRGEIPSRIKDIIGIVNQQSNYFKIRKPKENIRLFEFNISKVPIHVKKKYEILFKKQNK